MKTIPVESALERFFLGASPKTWQGEISTDDNGDQIMTCSFLGMPWSMEGNRSGVSFKAAAIVAVKAAQ